MMRRITLLTAACFLAGLSYSQEIKIIRQSDKTFQKFKTNEPFHFLEAELDTVNLTFVGTLQASTTKAPSMEKIYYLLKEEAQKLGANGMHLTSNSDSMWHVNIYRLDDDAIKLNQSLKPRNVFYIFAGDKDEQTSYHSFEFNGAAKTLKNGTFFAYTLKEGEQLKLKKGLVTGTILWIKWKPDQLPLYYSIHGFYKKPVVKRTTVSNPEKPGKFLPVNNDLGSFLIKVLTPTDLNH